MSSTEAKAEKEKAATSSGDGGTTQRLEPVLSINGKPIYLHEDWDHGIGGGLWSTGLAIAKYLGTTHGQDQLRSRRRVLELGSGNGFLGVCLLAANPNLTSVVITDTKEHLPLIKRTLELNSSIVSVDTNNNNDNNNIFKVEEYLWGPTTAETPKIITESKFDLIIGSDLAYRDELHDPLIESIVQCSTEDSTITLLGVTLRDTKPIFFQKIVLAGLSYERLADHLLDDTFRGNRFGVFVIWKNRTKKE